MSSLPPETRNRLGGLLLLGVGAILLMVSLFLDWFEPGISAWTTFEVWDMVLAALAIAAVIVAAGALTLWSPLPDSWMLAAAVVAPVVVIVSLLNHPPAAQGLDQDPMVGIWLALAGSLLMLVGAVLAVARISVALDHAATGAPAVPPVGQAPGERVARDRRGVA
ncbi:MAG: hypothetical protein M3401_11595, partial [Actinomycetota bacterium]|nr:hypothetical protein [Actinomycetota bacterium]